MKAPCGACETCEQCPYDDCTWDGVSPEEWEASKEADADDYPERAESSVQQSHQ